MENKPYIVNGVGFDNVEEAIEHLNKISKEIDDGEKQEMLARIKDSYKETFDRVQAYNEKYSSEDDKNDLCVALGIFDSLDKLLDDAIEAIMKELGFDD